MKNFYKIFVTVFLLCIEAKIIAYRCVLCNYGTRPIEAKMAFAGGPICPDWAEMIQPISKDNKSCSSFETHGCCLRGISLKDSKGMVPERWFGLDPFNERPDLQIMQETGAGMACANTKFSFWNDLEFNIFSSAGTAAKDYVEVANAKKIQESVK